MTARPGMCSSSSASTSPNISWALGIKAVFLVPAVLADMGASLLVVFDGLRLLRTKSNTQAA